VPSGAKAKSRPYLQKRNPAGLNQLEARDFSHE